MSEKTNAQTTVIVTNQRKSPAAAFVLAFLFGPLGLLYASIWGGIIMIVLSLVLVPFTAGLIAIVSWPVSILWALAATLGGNSTKQTAV